MQQTLINPDLSNKRVMVSLSGGINSAGVLCYLATEYYPSAHRPKYVYLFYSHLREHSPGTFRFVADCVRYARRHFERVVFEFVRGSVIKFFEAKKFIPHPMLSPCSEHLKAIPASAFAERHLIDVDLVGFVKTERRRIARQQAKGVAGKDYPIAHLTDSDCFELVKREIGWYPAIYDILDERGERVFKHNNCLPCKNMSGNLDERGATDDYADVALHFPEYAAAAQKLSADLGAYWGRAGNFDGFCRSCEDTIE